MDISALAISGGSPSSERTKLDRDLFVEGFGRGIKRVLVDGSAGLKDAEETVDSSPPEDWRSRVGGGSLNLFGVAAGCVGGVRVVAVVVAGVVVGGSGVAEVICLSLSSSLAVVVVAMVGQFGQIDRLQAWRVTAMETDSPTTLVSAKAAPSASALSTDSVTAATTSFKTPTQTTHDPEVVLPPIHSRRIAV